MSRALTASILTSMMAQESEEGYVILLEISHAALPVPIRICSNEVDLVSNAETFLAFPFQIDMPADTAEQLPEVTLTIENVTREIVAGVRAIPHGQGGLAIAMSVVTVSLPDTIEAGPFDFTMQGVEWDALRVSGSLTYENILNQAHPSHTFSPHDHPGLF